MLDLLFKRTSKAHVRSGSKPHLRDAPSSCSPPSSTSSEHHEAHWDIPSLEPPRPDPLNPSVLTHPTSTHQAHSTKPRRLALNLPPLLTKTEDSNLGSTNHDCHTQLQDFADSPEPSLQQSLTRLKPVSIHALTGDMLERVKKDNQSRALSGWFNGQSEPISIGVIPSPTKEISDPLTDMATIPTQSSHKPTLSSRFSFFGGKASPAKTPCSPNHPTDELMDMDLTTSLYPAGTADSFSPASFKNHMQHAEGLLSRLHAAYKERTIALRDVIAEKETQAEELEGAETRSKHLKIQLNDMSAKLAEQDKAMMELVDELANEKRLRREEEDARKKSIKLVKPSGIGPLIQCSEGCYDHHKSPLSLGNETDCESEDESSTESLFSRPQSSARMSLSSVSTTSSPESYHSPDLTGMATAQTARLRQAQPTANKSLCQPPTSGQALTWSCANCQGASSSEAWNVVHMLKEENRGLKDRVVHVESALDGCLDVIDRF